MVRFGLVLNRTSLVLVCIVPFMLAAIPFSLYYRTDDIRPRSSWRPARPWSPVW
ncbi:MAG: hypothetical protein MZV70_70255 [Desulfobacterales bacterium]|nr:hypothetical protein [Desulfobacterales bacterium]